VATDLLGTRPELSVIIVAFNCRRYLAPCLDSLERENESLPLEVVVIDNASTDGSREMVAHEYPWVRLVQGGGNVGFSVANNRGIEIATGRHILLLNPDTVVDFGALRSAVEELDRRPDVGMIGVKLVKPDGSLDHACKRGFPTPLASLSHFTGLSRRFPRGRFAGYTAGAVGEDEISLVDAVNGAFMLVRREALADVGRLDESYWMYMEDLDWCYRFGQAGWGVLYWPRVSVVHVKGGSSGNARTWRTNYAFHLGMWRFYREHYARRYSRVVTAAVWTGIWAKLGISAARSAVVRQVSGS
jgi:GT2 family glycosyltransferase